MNNPAKPFLFDHSFDAGAMRAEEEKVAAPVFSETDMTSARESGFQQGLVEGRAAAQSDTNQRQAEALAHVERLLGRLAEDVWKVYATQKRAASDIALTIARKILPEYTKKHGMTELTGSVEAAISEMINEPRLVLRVADMQFDFFSREINAMADRLGFGGKIIVLAEPTLGEQDCRIEWADGGMERNVNFTWSDIERQVSRHSPIAAQQLASALPAGETPAHPTTNIAV